MIGSPSEELHAASLLLVPVPCFGAEDIRFMPHPPEAHNAGCCSATADSMTVATETAPLAQSSG